MISIIVITICIHVNSYCLCHYQNSECGISIWCYLLDSKLLFALDTLKANRQLWKIQIEMKTLLYGTIKKFFTLFDKNSCLYLMDLHHMHNT